MNPHVISALEKIKTGDLKSAMDQIKFLCSEISVLQQNIFDINTELEKKVDLQSKVQDGNTTVTILGSGIISATQDSGATLIGSGTLFQKETSLNNQIKIGLQVVTIIGYDSLAPDTKITVSPSITGDISNQVYAIIKPVSKETLIGDFSFGELNGSKFNGVIAQDSTLEQRGRMTQPNDVVNVQFVQKNINPVMVRAQNAIQRDGDTIKGLSAINRYIYNYENTNINFGTSGNDKVELNYYGLTDSSNNLIVRQSLTDSETYFKNLIEPAYAIWNVTNSYGVNVSVGGIIYKCRNSGSPDLSSTNFSDYFVINAGVISLKSSTVIPTGYRGILLQVNAGSYWGINRGEDKYYGRCEILLNSAKIAESASDFDGPSGFSALPSTSVSATVPMTINDSLVVGSDTRNMGESASISHYLNLAKIGFYR